jgi:hypothetical protein
MPESPPVISAHLAFELAAALYDVRLVKRLGSS